MANPSYMYASAAAWRTQQKGLSAGSCLSTSSGTLASGTVTWAGLLLPGTGSPDNCSCWQPQNQLQSLCRYLESFDQVLQLMACLHLLSPFPEVITIDSTTDFMPQ